MADAIVALRIWNMEYMEIREILAFKSIDTDENSTPRAKLKAL